MLRRPTEAVAVPGDAVAAVAVETHPGGGERLTQLTGVVLGQRRASLLQHGVGKPLPFPVEAQQPRCGDPPVIHLPLLSPPLHPRRPAEREPAEELVRAGDPPGSYVDPGAVVEHGAADGPGEGAQTDVLHLVQQRSLQHHRPRIEHMSMLPHL